MTIHLMAKTNIALAALTSLCLNAALTPVMAQTSTVSTAQKTLAEQAAIKGVPVAELAPNAPQNYTVKAGDTLWAVSKLFLQNPWRWPELWGMNHTDIANPHLIYPGQQLVLIRDHGQAVLKVAQVAQDTQVAGAATGDVQASDLPSVRVSPRVRSESLSESALPALRSSAIEPFLAEPLIVTEAEFEAAPRIVSAQEGRVLLTRGDRAYARSSTASPVQAQDALMRVFRSITPITAPGKGEVLGYEALYAGKARVVRPESTTTVTDADGKSTSAIVPATLDIVSAKEEIRVGDRLLPEPPRQISTYVPHAPAAELNGTIVSVYGSAVSNAAQNQVVVINRGKAQGVDPGTVLAILKDGAQMVDKQDPNRSLLKLPDERIGLLMVFRTFEQLSYALILEITDGVRVGDRLASPR
jgi:nucleoid-associated protein YgaU